MSRFPATSSSLGPRRQRPDFFANGRRALSALSAPRATRPVELGRLRGFGAGLDSGDELANARDDQLAEPGAVEDAVMADTLGQIIMLSRLRDIDAQIVGGAGLADARDIVLLPFHAQKAGVVDRLQVDRSSVVGHLYIWQGVAHEHSL